MKKSASVTLLISVALLGSVIMSSTALAVSPQDWPWEYKFKLSPFIDQIWISTDPQTGGTLLHGYANLTYTHNCYPAPVLGWAAGGMFYMALDYKTSTGCYELGFVVGTISTRKGSLYRTTDGTTWVGPTAVELKPF